jgi:hypothetical protein
MLPNTVFPLTGPKLPYDSYTGDMVHRFYHMWQQSDCSVKTVTRANPSGCFGDLYPYVGIARGDDTGANSMGFFNMHEGDAPVHRHPVVDLCAQIRRSRPTLLALIGSIAVRRRLAAGGRGPPTNDQAKKSGSITPRDTVVAQCLQGKRSTVLALSRTLCAGSAGAAAFAATSLTAAARGALPGGRSGRRDGRFRSNKGM